ncbi:hypothetical protein [Bradyrhizobium sp. CCBAU 51753]|uniref:hypothetical protein n=1 Tax=Bradyrhizobium sp. CCBAU 51753 TaxID=1325100 RepID=UPI00188CE377|nr:hypothetical protein [Bradyrhizobium sp. CCBAU 51753]QOZ23932.1 hypothetical protein XH93_10175 [Bradyrhizobium sp. CCBAU 51753]
MTEIARKRRRFGHRRLHVPLKPQCHLINQKGLFRLRAAEAMVLALMEIADRGLIDVARSCA